MSADIVGGKHFKFGKRYPLNGGGHMQVDDRGTHFAVTIWAAGAGVGKAEKMSQIAIPYGLVAREAKP